MVIILRKIAYILLILVVNLYIVSYLNNKIISRIELRRGYKGYKRGGIGFPFSSSLKYISKEYDFSFWDILILVFSIMIWGTIPISFNLIIVDSEFSVLIAVVFYILIIILKAFSSSYSKYSYLISAFFKKTIQQLSLLAPAIFSILAVVILSKSLDFKVIVNSQYQYWNVVYQPIGFIVFFVSSVLQLKLLNLSEINNFIFSNNVRREGEGFSSLAYRFSGYISIFFMIMVLNLLYLGGWQKFYMIRGEIMLAAKFYFILILLIIIERAISNVAGMNKLVNLNYKLLLPLSFVNLMLTIVFLVLRNVYGVF